MEGISHEACSFAGTEKLGKLIAFYDDNGISIDGETRGWFTDDTPKRFEAYGWHVVPNVDGHDPQAIRASVEAARAEIDRPSLICCKTIIGYGAPNVQGTSATHGAALGAAEAAAARKNLGWELPPFEIPDDVKSAWDARERGKKLAADWQKRFGDYRAQVSRARGRVRAAHERAAAEGLAASTRTPRSRRPRRRARPWPRARRRRLALEAFAPAAAGAHRRVRRPHGLEQHAARVLEGAERRPSPAATICTTACASSAWPR